MAATATSNAITLKGSTEIVAEFFCKYIVFKMFYNKNCKVAIRSVKDLDHQERYSGNYIMTVYWVVRRSLQYLYNIHVWYIFDEDMDNQCDAILAEVSARVSNEERCTGLKKK